MKAHAMFQVIRASVGPNPFGPRVDDLVFKEVVEVARNEGILRGSCGISSDIAAIDSPLESQALDSVVEILRRAGWERSNRYVTAGSSNRYHIRKIREYSKNDIDACDLLYIASWGEEAIAFFSARNGERWVADVDSVGAHTRHGWNESIGYIEGMHNYFVSDLTRQRLEDEGLAGLAFHSLEWNAPERAKGKFWELASVFTMPRCTLPLVDLDQDGTLRYDDDGWQRPELEFPKNQVAKIGPFDIAECRETVGNIQKPNRNGRLRVVSQRFRRTVEKLGLGQSVTYLPVRLV